MTDDRPVAEAAAAAVEDIQRAIAQRLLTADEIGYKWLDVYAEVPGGADRPPGRRGMPERLAVVHYALPTNADEPIEPTGYRLLRRIDARLGDEQRRALRRAVDNHEDDQQ